MGTSARVVVAALLTAALGLPASAYATFPGGNGKIAFTSSRDGHGEIYIMDPNGANQTRLTFSAGSSQPAFSPDGKEIAWFASFWSRSRLAVAVPQADRRAQRPVH